MLGWIGIIIAGLIIGLLGKFVAPGGKDNTPLWLTLVCGIVGVLIGYSLFGGTNGFDWLAFFAAIVIAAVLVVVASSLTGRNKLKA